MHVAFAILLVLLAGGHAIADETVTTTDGRKLLLRENGTYKLLESPPSEPDGEYRQIALDDLKLDISDLMGELIEVRVSLSSFGDMIFLSDPKQPFDTTQIIADSEDLSRDDRQYILKKCNEGCRVTVRGEVAQVMFQDGVKLHTLVKR